MDDNLKGIGDLVNEALAQDGDASIKEGVQSQAEIDAQEASPGEEQPISVESKEAPGVPAPPVVSPGDNVVGDTPPDEATPPVDLSSQLDEMFPGRGFKTIEDVKAAEVNKQLSEAQHSKDRIAELENLNKDYAGKLSQKVDPWANPEMAELNSFVKETGINDASLFQTLKKADLPGMDARGVLEIQMRKDNPDLSQGEIRDYIQGHYNLDKKTFDHVIDEDEKAMLENEHRKAIQRSETALKIDGNKARAELLGLKEKIKPIDLAAQVDANQKAHEEKLQKMTEDWSPHIARSVDELRQFPIEIPGDDGKSEKLASFEVPTDKLSVYKQQALQFAINNGVEAASLEGQKAVNQFMANLIMIDFKDQIIQKTVNATRARMELEVEKEISNPTGEKLPVNPSQAANNTAKPKTAKSIEEDAFTAAERQIMSGDY